VNKAYLNQINLRLPFILPISWTHMKVNCLFRYC